VYFLSLMFFLSLPKPKRFLVILYVVLKLQFYLTWWFLEFVSALGHLVIPKF
jgi:hypothetical protein